MKMTIKTEELARSLYRVQGITPTGETVRLTMAGPTQTVSYTLPLTVSGCS